MVQPKICATTLCLLFSWLHILHCTVVIILGNLASIPSYIHLPWQYVACLPGQCLPNDPFEVAEGDALPALKGKGKRLLNQEGEREESRGPPLKKQKGICRLHNTTSRGYGRKCIFSHRCMGCGAMDEHGRISYLATTITVVPGRGEHDHLDGCQGTAPRK